MPTTIQVRQDLGRLCLGGFPGGRGHHRPLAAADPPAGGGVLLLRLAVYPRADSLHGGGCLLQLHGQRLRGDKAEQGVLLDLSRGGGEQHCPEPLAHPADRAPGGGGQ